MSDDYRPENESDEYEDAELEKTEYEEVDEEISSDEVDRVLESLTNVMENLESETIHELLEETYNQVFGLIYEDEDGDVEAAELDFDEEFDEELDMEDDELGDEDLDDEDLDDEQAEAA